MGHNACLQGYTTRYYRLSRLLLAFTQAKADGSYHKLLAQTAKIRLLLIDDWGLEALTTAQRHDLMEIMDDRHGAAPTVMVSQLPVDQWYVTVGDNTLADAPPGPVDTQCAPVGAEGGFHAKKDGKVDRT